MNEHLGVCIIPWLGILLLTKYSWLSAYRANGRIEIMEDDPDIYTSLLDGSWWDDVDPVEFIIVGD